MASNYREMNFEEHIESHLLNTGYRKRTPEEYDKALCLIPDEVIQFIQTTQPKEFEKLEKQYGAETSPKLLERIAREVGKYGVLYVLRKGVADRGAKFKLAYFKPSSGMNPEHQTLYQGNRFSVVRQLKYSQKNENSIDTALFLNGLPIVTIELKNSLTGQTLENAEKQYKHDRLPNGEPLLAFKRCLVHFAVGNEQARERGLRSYATNWRKWHDYVERSPQQCADSTGVGEPLLTGANEQVRNQNKSGQAEQNDFGENEQDVFHNILSLDYSLLCETCSSSASTLLCITSVNGAG